MSFLIKRSAAACLVLSLTGSSWAGLASVPVLPQDVPAAESSIDSVAAKSQTPLAFREGEDLTFVIKWGLVTGGYSSLKVNAVEWLDGSPTYHVVAQARSAGVVNSFYHVNDRNEAWLQPQTPRTIRYARDIEEGKYRLKEKVDLDHKSGRFYQHAYRADKKKTVEREGEIPTNVLDVLGSLYYVRTLPLAVGKTYTIDVHSGSKVYPLVVKVKKRARVKVKAGTFDCFVVEPELREPGIFISKGKKLEVFLTADERRMPVMMRSEVFIGHVSAELISHNRTPPGETYRLTQAEKDAAAAELAN